MTLVWFVVWLVCDLIGDKESLTFDPVNGWAGTLILAIALVGWFVFQFVVQESFYDWLGERIDNLTD